MAKELPYFRFTPQEWQNGDISLERFELRGFFIDLCCYYWINDCSIAREKLDKRYINDLGLLNELIALDIIEWDEETNFIHINFLNEQFDVLSTQRKRRQDAGSKGGKQKSSNAIAKLKQKSSYKDKYKEKDNNKDKEETKDTFVLFWDHYHNTTGLPKTDRTPAKKYWNKISIEDQRKAYTNVKPYFDSLPTYSTGKPLKKARTYLSDKNYEDEFTRINTTKSIGNYIELTEKEKQDRNVNTTWTYIHYKDTYKKVHTDSKGNYIENGRERVYL